MPTDTDHHPLDDLSVYDWMRLIDTVEPGAVDRLLAMFPRETFAAGVDKWDATQLGGDAPTYPADMRTSPVHNMVGLHFDGLWSEADDSEPWLFDLDTKIANFVYEWYL